MSRPRLNAAVHLPSSVLTGKLFFFLKKEFTMQENKKSESSVITQPKATQGICLPYDEATVRRLAAVALVMLAWIFIWALVLKLGDEATLIRNYTNLKDMTVEERIRWDLIPFNYRGTEYWKIRQVINTVLNCFVFAPFGVALGYAFKKRSVLRDGAICFGFSLCVETLQLLTVWGNPATEDLITNVTGYFIGLGLHRLILARLSVKQTVRVLAIANALLFVTVILSLVSTAMAADVIVKIVTGTL